MAAREPGWDLDPFETPSTLQALKGPDRGVLTLPATLRRGADASVDLSTQAGVEEAYEVLVRGGTPRQQEELLNAEILRRVWPLLRLPERCRDLWQARFPELAHLDGPRREPRRPDHPKPGFHI